MNKLSSFAKKYSIFLLILFLLVFAVLGIIWLLMKNYQGNFQEADTRQEWLLSQTAFEEYVARMNLDDWVDLWYSTYPDSFDLENDVKSILEQRLAVNTNYARAKGYSDDAPVYVIEDDSGAIAEFSLEKDASDAWIVSSAVMRMSGSEKGSVCVPSNCTVLCGNTVLDESYVSDTQSCYSMESSFGSDVSSPVCLLTYTVTNQLTAPVFTVNAPDGCELSTDRNGNPVVVKLTATDVVVDECLRFFDDYMYYCMLGYFNADINAKAAAAHCRVDSQAQSIIFASVHDMSAAAPCYSNYTSDVSAGSVLVWADNALSVDISYYAEGYYQLQDPYIQDGVLRVHLIDYGNGYEICGIENIISE